MRGTRAKAIRRELVAQFGNDPLNDFTLRHYVRNSKTGEIREAGLRGIYLAAKRAYRKLVQA